MLAALPLREALRHYFLGGVEWGETEIGLARFFGKAAYQGDPMLADRVVRPIADVMCGMMTAILTQATEREGNSGKMGLGLAISKALVETQGGKISAEFAGNRQGATFTITFSVYDQATGVAG